MLRQLICLRLFLFGTCISQCAWFMPQITIGHGYHVAGATINNASSTGHTSDLGTDDTGNRVSRVNGNADPRYGEWQVGN